MGRLREQGSNFIKSDKFIPTLLRAGAASQVASWVDLFTGFALFAWAGFAPVFATAVGAIVGGVINCVINFHFTFHAQECSWKAVIVKYFMVWIGSIMLNSFGTMALYNLLQSWDWLESIGFKPDGYYSAARLSVSIVVSLFWNLLLQARFVYRVTRFDPYAIHIMDALNIRRLSHKE